MAVMCPHYEKMLSNRDKSGISKEIPGRPAILDVLYRGHLKLKSKGTRGGTRAFY